METNQNRTNTSRAFPFILGTLFGCLGMLILGGCLLAGAATLIFRPDTDRWTAQSSADPVENGRLSFQRRCTPCHSTGTEGIVGPGLAGLFSPGGPELPAGVDYDGRLPNGEEITETNVASWIREGGKGEIGRMPGQALSEAQMADLIAYLKTLER